MKKLLTLLALFVLTSVTVYAVGVGSGGANVESTTEAEAEVEATIETEPAFVPEPEATSVTAEVVDFSTAVCHDLEALEQRVECRLVKGAEALNEEPFMPEECRVLEDKIQADCLGRYQDLYPCWDETVGPDRISCVKGILGLPEEIVHVDEYCGEGFENCKNDYVENVFALIKYRFYDGEERVEYWYEAGRLELADAVEYIVAAANGKIAFNEADSYEERMAAIEDVMAAWDAAVAKVQK